MALAQAMAAARTQADAVRDAAAGCRAALDADFAAVSVWERDRGRLRVLVNSGALAPGEEEAPADESYPLADYPEVVRFLEERGLGGGWSTDGLPRAWVQTVDGASVNGPDCAARVAGLRRRGRGCALVAPILLRGRAWGELYLARAQGRPVFDAAEAEFGTVLAAQLAAGLAQTEALEEVRRLAFTDPLTGLPNRRAVDAALDAALERHRADGAVVTLAVCDVNGLKRVNDELGHERGDRLLEQFAARLAQAGADLPGSTVGRLGGDEFCLLAAGAPADEVIRAAERLCAQALTLGAGDGVACGIASTADPIGPVTTAARLFRLADAAQYRAKAGQAAQPVVAGRDELTVRLADAPARPSGPGTGPGSGPGSAPGTAGGAAGRRTERRRFRGARHSADPGRLLAAGLAVLDEHTRPAPEHPEPEHPAPDRDRPMPDPVPRVHPADTLGRLEAVAQTTAHLLDAVAWWISYVPPGSTLMRTCRYGVRRMTRGPGSVRAQVQRAVNEAPDAVFDLRSYPLTARAVRGQSFWLRTGAPGNEPGEEAVLVVGGYRGIVAAGGANPAGGWLLEIFADDSTLGLSAAAPALRALVAVALSGPASPPP